MPRVIGATGGLFQNSPIVYGGSQNRNNYLTSQPEIRHRNTQLFYGKTYYAMSRFHQNYLCRLISCMLYSAEKQPGKNSPDDGDI